MIMKVLLLPLLSLAAGATATGAGDRSFTVLHNTDFPHDGGGPPAPAINAVPIADVVRSEVATVVLHVSPTDDDTMGPAPPAPPAPVVNATCQLELNAWCNNASTNAKCLNDLAPIKNVMPLMVGIWAHGTDLTNSDIASGVTWLAQMDAAAAQFNVSLQFCMMNPCHALQSTLVKQLTNGRATWDNHREYNGVFTMGQNSLLYWSLGFFASRDNVWSSANTVNQTGCVEGGAACFQHNAALENAVAVLSNGPYGISDEVGKTDGPMVMRSCRSDGVTLRPSWPLSSLDVAFTKHNGALLWAAHDEHDEYQRRWTYVLAVNLATEINLTAAELGQGHGDSAMVAWKRAPSGAVGKVTIQPFDATHPLTLTACPLPKNPLAAPDPGSLHWNVAPVLKGGLIILGEISKWATMSARRVSAFSTNDKTTTAVITGAPGEVVVIAYIARTSVPKTTTCSFPSAAASSCRAVKHNNTDCTLILTCEQDLGCSCGKVPVTLSVAMKTDDASTTTFFVSPSGNDVAQGLSREAPVKSLERAQLLVRAHLQAVALKHTPGVERDVTVVLMNGSWFNTSLHFTAADGAGTGTERVMWKADTGAASTVFGGARVVGWTHWRDGIWRAPLPPGLTDAQGRATFQSLVEGERSCWNARTPDSGSGWLAVNASSFSNQGFEWNVGALPDQFDCVRSACSVFARAMYSSDIRPVLSVDLAQRRLAMVGGPTTDKLRGAGGPTVSEPAVYISGAVEFISAPGEWAVRDHQLYYMPYEPVDPSLLTITAPATKRVLSFIGTDRHAPARGLSIVGLRLVGSDMPALFVWSCMSESIMDGPGATKPPCSSAEGQPNTTPQSSAHGLVFTENATDIEICNCTIHAAGGPAAIWLQEASSNVRISSNVIEDIAGHGIYANGIAPNDTRFPSAAESDVNFGHVIEDNLIVSGGSRTTHASGIFLFQSGRSAITHNKIAQFPRDAVAYYGMCCLNWNAPQIGAGASGVTPRYLSGSKYWGKYLSISGQQNGTLATSDVNHCRDNLLAWNEFSQCNREGIDGGVVESNGNGGNNTWEFNAVHDNEGPGNLFFADDLSSGLTIRNNLLFENSNSLGFMMSLNQTVERNIIADNTIMDVFYLSVYHLPTYNMSIQENLIWNSTEGPGATPCNASTNMSQSLDCASFYSIEACNPDLFGLGLDFSTGTLVHQLTFGNSGSSCKSRLPGLPALGDGHCIPWSLALFGFTQQQLATPIVRSADFNFVDDASRLHVGATSHWDQHTSILTASPFKPVAPARPWHSKTALDYQLVPGSAAAKAGVGLDVTQIGPRTQPRETYPLRRGFEKVSPPLAVSCVSAYLLDDRAHCLICVRRVARCRRRHTSAPEASSPPLRLAWVPVRVSMASFLLSSLDQAKLTPIRHYRSRCHRVAGRALTASIGASIRIQPSVWSPGLAV